MKKAPSRLETKLTLRGTTQIPHHFTCGTLMSVTGLPVLHYWNFFRAGCSRVNLQKLPSEGLSAGEPSLCRPDILLYCLCHCVLHIDDGSTFKPVCQVCARHLSSSATCCIFYIERHLSSLIIGTVPIFPTCQFPVICEFISKHLPHFLTRFSFYGIITLWQYIICILSFILSIRAHNMQVISRQYPSKRRNFYGFSDTDHWETEKHRPDRP